MKTETLAEQVQSLGLPVGRACRCGGRMQVREVDDSHDWPVVLWDCRCGRSFACQVKPETGEIVASEWQG